MHSLRRERLTTARLLPPLPRMVLMNSRLRLRARIHQLRREGTIAAPPALLPLPRMALPNSRLRLRLPRAPMDQPHRERPTMALLPPLRLLPEMVLLHSWPHLRAPVHQEGRRAALRVRRLHHKLPPIPLRVRRLCRGIGGTMPIPNHHVAFSILLSCRSPASDSACSVLFHAGGNPFTACGCGQQPGGPGEYQWPCPVPCSLPRLVSRVVFPPGSPFKQSWQVPVDLLASGIRARRASALLAASRALRGALGSAGQLAPQTPNTSQRTDHRQNSDLSGYHPLFSAACGTALGHISASSSRCSWFQVVCVFTVSSRCSVAECYDRFPVFLGGLSQPMPFRAVSRAATFIRHL
ncbi:hypothetical protein C8R43DRAFT_519795 [Mycena crocata]|nr:hypothetical protein C8R43DRAFT_519795 [Mycena crocata]